MDKELYDYLIREIVFYKKEYDRFNEIILRTNDLAIMYGAKGHKLDCDSKIHIIIGKLLIAGNKISDIEKDIDDLYEEAN